VLMALSGIVSGALSKLFTQLIVLSLVSGHSLYKDVFVAAHDHKSNAVALNFDADLNEIAIAPPPACVLSDAAILLQPSKQFSGRFHRILPGSSVKQLSVTLRFHIPVPNACAQPRASSHVGCSALFGSNA
jgi:hypothetical protein